MLRSIEFRRVGGGAGALQYLVDGVSFLELVRRAELPDALAEQAERAGEFAPEAAPLPAGAYAYPVGLGAAHLLGGVPDMVPHGAEAGETLLLGCDCGIVDCWALTARITVGAETVTWSGLRNTCRDWSYDSLGALVFPRGDYERSLRESTAQ